MKLIVGLVSVVVILVVVAAAFPTLWQTVTGASGNITGMAGTDTGTTMVKTFWPIVLLVVGLGIAVGLIMFGLRKFGVLKDG